MNLFSILPCIGIAGAVVDNLELFEQIVEQKLSALKYKWVIILIANYNSHSKAVKYIIDNFTTIDILSEDIDFNLIGYTNEDDKPINSRRIASDGIIDAVLIQLDSLSASKDITEERICAIKEKLERLKSSPKAKIEDYPGGIEITTIYNKRLGTIWFNESVFADFVSELSEKTENKYTYLGGCDMVMIPYINLELRYKECKTFRLDDIINADASLSLDGFMYRMMKIIKHNTEVWKIPSLENMPYSEALSEYEKFIDVFKSLYHPGYHSNQIKKIKEDAERIIKDGKTLQLFSLRIRSNKKRIIKRINASLNFFKDEYDNILTNATLHDLDTLYEKATSKIILPSRKELIIRIITDIENHIHWKLSESFFFISYSTKDKSKAELIRKLLVEHGARVWIAPDGIPQGRDYASVIPATLQHAKNFVLILTRNSANSIWVLREIDAAINNSQARLRIVLADGFTMEELSNYQDLKFYLNKVQISYNYEDIIQDDNLLRNFMYY